MQATIFYTNKTNKACTLVLIEQSEFDSNSYIAQEKNYLLSQQFSAKLGEVALIYDQQGCLNKAFIGAGEGNSVTALAYAATRLPKGHYALEQELPLQALLIWSLAQYRFDRYKQPAASPRVLVLTTKHLDALLPEADAVFLVRDLINTPTNDLGPSELALIVETLAKEKGAEFKQWVGNELLIHNFPAIHAVGRAAKDAPRLLSLAWGDERHPRVALIGKGVCFDSGGLDLKPSQGMRLMKKDMGGAAQVIGLAHWIMTKGLPIRLEVYIPAVENAVSADSYRPGDVIRMRNGMSVEIDNTDAEGRLVLADAMVKACEQKPELIIDFATLTGAARTAVGTEIAAMFTNNDSVADDLMKASISTGDPLWRMPLFASYLGMLDSSIADIANSGPSPYAGAITAALFLQRFITPSLPWVHFDIMAWNVGNKPGKPEGGEAMAMRAVAEYLMKRYG
jgi:leucyl aminopeptidase